MGTIPGTRPSSSRGRLLRRTLALAAVLAVLAFLLWRYTRPQPVPVVVAEVDRGRVERSVANTRAGTVNACRRAKLAPPAGGQIVALPVREGDRVRAGQVLLELWNEDAAAQARLAEEQARTARLRVEEACARADVAERDAERAGRLHRDGLIPDEQHDRAVSSAKTLRAACEAARAEVEQSQARIELARANLTRTVLRAPFAGVVAKVSGELGEFTTPSPPGIPTPPAVDLIDDSCLYVTAPIDEVDAARVSVGQPAYITIDAFPGRRFPGRVRRVAPYVVDVEKQARTVDVEVEFSNRQDVKALLVGYSADVEIVLGVREDVVRVPTQVLLDGSRVLVFTSNAGTLEERRVETGISNWEYTEVKSGVQPGEQVVLSVDREGVVPGAKAVAESGYRR
ncbi:MAG: efflux RND transporter periplasmic adaptor subunit [Acidobacteria bacterium]|nr:efflux RND transporter periplasmic adaptor subunit [Acidobacteriota bacterium]